MARRGLEVSRKEGVGVKNRLGKDIVAVKYAEEGIRPLKFDIVHVFPDDFCVLIILKHVDALERPRVWIITASYIVQSDENPA